MAIIVDFLEDLWDKPGQTLTQLGNGTWRSHPVRDARIALRIELSPEKAARVVRAFKACCQPITLGEREAAVKKFHQRAVEYFDEHKEARNYHEDRRPYQCQPEGFCRHHGFFPRTCGFARNKAALETWEKACYVLHHATADLELNKDESEELFVEYDLRHHMLQPAYCG